MPLTLETTRTILRPFELRDAPEAFSWFSDAEVMRYIPSGPDATVEDTASRLCRYIDHQATHGFSKWVIMDRETQRLIGDAGFYHLPDGKRIELGYRLSRPYWGTGLATEVARRWIEVATDFLTDSTLFAFTHPDNLPSRRVLQKLGFKHLGTEVLYGLEAPLYELPLGHDRS
jgi:RimJ/RimL family protein N-acetyltransferase